MSAALQSPEELPLFLCIGDLDVDVLIEVDRLPTRDGKVNGVVKQKAPGGMAGNVAAALARLGSRVRVLGRVGDDADGAFAVKSLEQVGVDTSFVSRLDGRRDIQLHQPADAGRGKVARQADDIGLSAGRRRRNARRRLRVLATCISPRSATPPSADAWWTLHELRRATASLDIERADCPEDAAALLDAIKGFDLIFCNAELRAFVDAALERPLAGLVAAVVTTLGADGAQVETAEGRIASPGFTPKIVDTTGAGDCFAAACLHARLAAKLDWRDALRFANCAAAISTTGLGAQSALPTADQVAAHLRRSQPEAEQSRRLRNCEFVLSDSNGLRRD